MYHLLMVFQGYGSTSVGPIGAEVLSSAGNAGQYLPVYEAPWGFSRKTWPM